MSRPFSVDGTNLATPGFNWGTTIWPSLFDWTCRTTFASVYECVRICIHSVSLGTTQTIDKSVVLCTCSANTVSRTCQFHEPIHDRFNVWEVCEHERFIVWRVMKMRSSENDDRKHGDLEFEEQNEKAIKWGVAEMRCLQMAELRKWGIANLKLRIWKVHQVRSCENKKLA